MIEYLAFIGFGLYSVGLVYGGWYVGRMSKWQEANDVPPSVGMTYTQVPATGPGEDFMALRSQPVPLSQG
jgi:hypothetical protein